MSTHDSRATPETAPHASLDGVLALGSLLRHGFEVSVYPRQVMAAARDGQAELSFAHGLPGTSGLAPVTYAQDKRMRRALLERAGVPVPRGATFTISRGIPGAKRFAADVGFPVVIKPAVGDNIIETFAHLADNRAIDVALDQLRTPPAERPGFSRAAYGLTELREPGEENGRIVVPPGYTFLVEKQLSGQYLRLLVIEGTVGSVIACNGAPGDGSLSSGEEIRDRVHPGFLDLAQRATRTIPGLALAAVDIVAPDPFANPADQTVGVVELSERPGLWVQSVVDPNLAARLAEQIVSSYGHGLGYTLSESRNAGTVRLEAHAVPDVAEGAAAIESAARRIGLRATITGTDRLAGVVEADLGGSLGAIASLTDALLDGRIADQRVMLAVLTPRATR